MMLALLLILALGGLFKPTHAERARAWRLSHRLEIPAAAPIPVIEAVPEAAPIPVIPDLFPCPKVR